MCMTTLRLAYKQMQTNYTIATGLGLTDTFDKQIRWVGWVSMIMNIRLTFTLQYLKSMMDSHNLSLEKHAKPVCSSVDLHSPLIYNWCFYREGIAHERYRVQTTLLCQIMAYTSTRPGAHRIELLSRYKRVVTVEECQTQVDQVFAERLFCCRVRNNTD